MQSGGKMKEVSTLGTDQAAVPPLEPKPAEKPTEKCVFCRREIRQGERRYFSRQAGMKGLYHWPCFVEACRLANQQGAKNIETALKQLPEPESADDLRAIASL